MRNDKQALLRRLPVNTKPMEVSNRTLVTMFTALLELGNRSMANTLADLKVGRLLHALAPTCEPIQPARQRIIARFSDGRDVEGMSESASQVHQALLNAELADYDGAVIEVAMPTMRITQDDLPKEKPGDGGWKNAAQLGAITSGLDILFEFPEEPKE